MQKRKRFATGCNKCHLELNCKDTKHFNTFSKCIVTLEYNKEKNSAIEVKKILFAFVESGKVEK